jgi:phenylalanyl-tRNA synthetase beta chain
VFEIARVVNGLKEDGMCNEEKKLCITLFSKTKNVTDLYYDLANMIASVVDDIKHQKVEYKAAEAKLNYIHPRNYNEIVCGGVSLGNIGIVHPTVSKKIDKKASIVFLEIDMNKLVSVENKGIHYVEAPKYPTIDVDVTFVCNKYAPIANAIKEVNSALIKKEAVVDTYEDESGKSITVRLTFMHEERTLTKDEVMEIVDKIIAILKSQGIEMKQ